MPKTAGAYGLSFGAFQKLPDRVHLLIFSAFIDILSDNDRPRRRGHAGQGLYPVPSFAVSGFGAGATSVSGKTRIRLTMQKAYELGIESLSAFGIVCRILSEEDLELLYEWRNRKEIRDVMDDSRFVSMPVLKFWYKKIYNADRYFPYIVSSAGSPCAYMEIKNIHNGRKTAELGIYMLGNRYMGKGIAEKAALCWEIFLARLKVRTAFALIYKENARSMAFFEKIGGVKTSLRRDFFVYRLAEETRRACLGKIAAKHNAEEEFFRLLGSAAG